ncbi:hypothetical protein niasHS_015390 [Heterodera schachtii]|uniref:BTB domain-containing protein n=1 Tax=Heterodera schachtii TaxID=97005 RepID=A0ABD2I041_HETSC
MASNLVDRLKLMLSTGNGADIQFLVGQGEEKELLKAHKCIMMTASNVFESMFRFDDKNPKTETPTAKTDGSVEIPDISANAFKVMLSFIYAEDLSELNGDNAMAVLYAANKYNVSSLVKACSEFPINELSNVFFAHDQARLLNENDFSRRCLDYIDQNAETLLQSEQFLQIDQNMLCEIIGRDQLKIDDELTIWNAAIRWADARCAQILIDCSAKNRRDVLGPALFKIRFALITKRDFSKIIVPSCVLTMEELLAVFQFHCHPNLRGWHGQYPMAFPCHGRFSDQKKGTFAMEIEKLSEFAREGVNSNRYSEGIYIKGLPWKLWAQICTKKDNTEKWLGFYLLCTAPKDGTWSCKCSATFRIVSQKSGVKDVTKKIDHTFNNKSASWGFSDFITFEHLMDTDKGLYDKDEDTVSLEIEVNTTEEQKGTKRKVSIE